MAGLALLAAPRPVVQFTLALNHSLGGGVWGYHAFNLAIHLLAALTLFGIVRRTLTLPALAPRFARASTALAFCIALLWALHPLQTESVTYVIQRMESLMGLFYLLTLYCFIRAASSPTLRMQPPRHPGTPGTATDSSFPVSWRLGGEKVVRGGGAGVRAGDGEQGGDGHGAGAGAAL